MVYFGPSRGCETCKRRRKKCDEKRPSCMRCTASGRTCGGYEDGADRVFRQYNKQDGDSKDVKSTARKCSLPVRTNGPAADVLPQEITDGQVEEYALRAFFYDYCIVSTNRSLSRGYLDGLEKMVHQQGADSDLAKACKVVAFACQGIKLSRPTTLTRKAEMIYHDVLGSLAKVIANIESANVVESVVIAMLLGLYEIVVAKEDDPGNQKAHTKGIAAILQIPATPSELLVAARTFRSDHNLIPQGVIEKCGIFAGPYSNFGSKNLDNTLIAFGPFWNKANAFLKSRTVSIDELFRLRSDAIAFSQALANGNVSDIKDFVPWTIGQIGETLEDSVPEVGCWPGKVDMYFDIQVAAVWNTSRAAQILLLDLVSRISAKIDPSSNNGLEQRDLLFLVESIVSSIPFLLAEDLQVFLRNTNGCPKEITNPGRSAGGLLLMHPLFVISRLPLASPRLRAYVKDCLEWITTRMGIGQASVLAQTENIHEDYFTDGCTIVWAGMLL